jgi:hypothetical protein
MRNEASRARLAAICAAAALITFSSGCATGRPMALSSGAVPLNEQQGLALATLKVANVYKTGYQPHVKSLTVQAPGEQGETIRFQATPFRASPDEADQFEEILVSLALPPGTYALNQVFVTANGALTFGNGVVPVFSAFKVEPGRAVYVGRVEAVRRERKGDEPRAGGVIPLIDQAVTGFSGGTFDVKVVDRYDEDVALFKATYAPLASVAIEKALLSAPAPR